MNFAVIKSVQYTNVVSQVYTIIIQELNKATRTSFARLSSSDIEPVGEKISHVITG